MSGEKIATRDRLDALLSQRDEPEPELSLDPPELAPGRGRDWHDQVAHLEARLGAASRTLRADEARARLTGQARDEPNQAADPIGRAESDRLRAHMEWLDAIERDGPRSEHAHEAAEHHDRAMRDVVAMMDNAEPLERDVEVGPKRGRSRSR